MTDTERNDRLRHLLTLPWTIRHEFNAEEGYHVLRVTELPSVLATGITAEELETDFWEAMRCTLASFLEDGEEVPTPRVPFGHQDEVVPPPKRVIFSATPLNGSWDLRLVDAATSGASPLLVP